MKQKIEKRIIIEGREIRFTNFIDEESRMFEESGKEFLNDCSIDQTLISFERSPRECFLMQTRALDGTPAMQSCIYVGRSSWFPFLAMATVPNMPRAINAIEEEFGIKCLKHFCSEIPGVMTLRLQPKRFESHELINFQARAGRNDFEPVEPLGIVRTLLLNLQSSAEGLYLKLPGKTRQKFRHPDANLIEMRVLNDFKWISRCEKATTASRKRSGSNKTSYDFKMAFDLAKNHPERAQIIGLFFKHRPEELLAYVIGFTNGERCEYSSAGAMSDSELRKIPFNYFLVWELMNWARQAGCTEMDLGGVTDGGPNDPLQGITRFKRSLTNQELEVGREVISVIRPVLYFIYRMIKQQPNVKQNQQKLQPAYD